MSVKRSKRIPTKTRMIAAKKVREKFRKEARAARKKERSSAKIPRALLLTEAEREQIKLIKEETAVRTEEHNASAEPSVPGYVAELRRAMETCDVFVEILDHRDIAGSRSRRCEALLREAGKELLVYLNHLVSDFEVPYTHLEAEGMRLVRGFGELAAAGRVCILGNPKSGKYLLSRELAALNPAASAVRITTPIERASPTAVMRSAVDAKHIDCYATFGQIYPFLDAQAVVDHFMIKPYASMEDLLMQLGRMHSVELRQRRCMDAGALHFLTCARNGQIRWARTDDRYLFRF